MKKLNIAQPVYPVFFFLSFFFLEINFVVCVYGGCHVSSSCCFVVSHVLFYCVACLVSFCSMF
eukprot:m.349493 g.349493  ORF g.349493 m.349493 type:complete len:63 (+) comp16151_c1_seq2:680-868(+)